MIKDVVLLIKYKIDINTYYINVVYGKYYYK